MAKVILQQIADMAGVSLPVAAKVISRNNSNVRVSPNTAYLMLENY